MKKRENNYWLMYIVAGILIVFGLMVLPGLKINSESISPYNKTIPGECSADKDCRVAGCSGQVCTTADKAGGIFTTCEWKSEYDCYAKTSCGCINGYCRWEENSEFMSCLENALNAE